jgi:hypothetical protein
MEGQGPIRTVDASGKKYDLYPYRISPKYTLPSAAICALIICKKISLNIFWNVFHHTELEHPILSDATVAAN